MMPSLQEFFSNEHNFDVLREFIDSRKSRTNKLSFGLLDWFNVNYSKQYNIEYKHTKLGRTKVVYVWQAYNSALNGYGKHLFDPFARGKNKGGMITLTNDKGESVKTTLRQLNYFRWAINNGVIDYVKAHVDEIYDDFYKRNRGVKKVKGQKKKKISESASGSLGIHKLEMTVHFG